MQAKRMIVDSPNLPKEEEQEHRPSNDIEDTVPDHLARRGDNIRALAQRSTDGVGDEHERHVGRGHYVSLLQCAALGEGTAGRLPEKDEPDVDEGGGAKDVVAPFVGGGDECADEAHDDEEGADEGGGYYVGERETGGEQELEEEDGEGYEPLDVSHVLVVDQQLSALRFIRMR